MSAETPETPTGTPLEPLLSSTGGDARALIDTAQEAVEPRELDPNKLYAVVGHGAALLDVERFRQVPHRKRGTVVLATVESLIAYVRGHKLESTTVWVHPTSGDVVAVINDHGFDELDSEWGDHRAALTLLESPQWTHWKRRDGVLGTQEEFAEHLEDGVAELVDPDAATMLELAQSFHATTQAAFRQASRLSSGEVKLLYDEKVEASAGTSGELPVPSEFILAVPPFVGEDAYRLTARLRYRVGGGTLKIGYKLDRPEDVVRDALERIKGELGEAFDQVYSGTPREARS